MSNRSSKISLKTLPVTVLALLAALGLLSACSTTKRIPDGEYLYTGVKKFTIKPTDHEKLPEGMVSDLKEAINVAPNNPMPFLSPYVRIPFPIGLWVYNNWNDSAKGFKGWLYNMLVAQPVLISDVRPEARTKMMENILDNNGYFGSNVSYTLLPDKKNPKKVRIDYTADVSTPYLLDSIIYLNDTTKPLCREINFLAHQSKYLVPGERFSTDSLAAERTRIANRLRNKGYYYFQPEYIEFLADSTIHPHAIALKLTLTDNMPPFAFTAYKTGKVTVHLNRLNQRSPEPPDTIYSDKCEVIVQQPQRIRKNLIPSCITFRKGRVFSVNNMDRTQNRLARLGIFSGIEMNVTPSDSSLDGGTPTLDVDIICRYDRPMEAAIEVNATSKSNSYIGPGLSLSLTNRNIFGGGEQLSVSLDGSYEWQTGHGKSSVFNSYEIGLSGTLSFPRLLAPGFIRRIQRDLNWTRLNLSGKLLNRPHYFKMMQFNTGISYEWRATRNVLNNFTPFKLTYTKLIHTTAEFDSIMAVNPAIAESFKSQFIPQMSYTYTLDKFLEKQKMNGINFSFTLTEAGNLFDAIYMACGVKGEKKLFGTPFSQFVKGQAQLVYSRRLFGPGSDHWLVSRVLIGAAHAYGNSSVVPYSEQFYIGGANSIRAFTVRSLGPGSYRPPEDQINGYFDQTGTFKFELNTEYRFPIVGIVHGAVFLDAGNIWLLKNDPMRPGGLLQGKTFLRDIALGTGVGLRFDISMLVLRGDLGYGLHAPYRNGTPHYFNIKFKHAFAFHLAIGYPF